MVRSGKLRTLFFGVSLMVWTMTDLALAEEPSSRVEAKTHFERGLALVDEGKIADALEEFERAYALVPHPSVLLNIARAQADLGDPLRAVELLEGMLRDSGDTLEPALATAAREQLEQQRARLAVVTLDVSQDGARVLMDGRDLGPAPLAAPVRLNPGHHVVSTKHEALETISLPIDLAEGEQRVLLLSPPPRPALPPVAALTPTLPPSAHPEPAAPSAERGPAHRWQRPLGWSAVGLGGVGFVASAWLWGRADAKHEQALEHCTPRCDDTARSLQHEAVQAAQLTTATLVAGAGLVAVGGVLVLMAPPSTRSPDAGTAQRRSITVVPRPLGVVVEGNF